MSHPRMLTARVACEFFGGGLFLLLGIIFAVVIPAMWFPVIKPFGLDQIKTGVLANDVVTSNSSTGYEMWLTNNSPDAPPYLLSASFYNLTNLEQVLNGSIPIFNEVGPYFYIYNRTKFNVEWLTDPEGEPLQVRYNEYRRMGFLPDLSNGTDDTDIIVNINPAFLAVVTQANGFLGMMIGLSGPTLGKLWQNWFSTAFIEHVQVERIANVLSEQAWGNSSVIVVNNQTYSWLDVWANFTYTPNSYFEGFVISDTGSNSSVPSDISLEVAQYLFNATADYSLLNTDFDMAQVWYNASKLPLGSPGQVNAGSILTQATGLTEEQLNIVINWINSQSFTTRLQTYIMSQYNLADIGDLSYLQWIDGTVTYNGESIATLYEWEYAFPYNPIEFAYTDTFGPPPPNLVSVELTKFFLNDSNVGVFNSVNLGEFCNLATDGSVDEIDYIWGLNETQAAMLGAYFTVEPGPTIGNLTLVQDVLPNNGGLFVSRNARDWLFNATDTLLLYVQPSAPKAALLRNDSSYEDAMAFAPSTYMTGYDNYTDVADIVAWEGQTQIVGVYAEPIPVYGTNDWGQFRPFLTTATPLNSFSEDYMRTFNLYYNSTTYEFSDLELYRYMIDQSAFNPNDTLYQYPEFQGFANLTSGHNSTPVFLSNPHFQGVVGNWSKIIEGVVPNPLNDTTVVDIDPITGSVLHVYQASQVNLFTDPAIFSTVNASLPYYENVQANTFYPVVWIAEQATVNEPNAKKVKQVHVIQDVFDYGIYAFIVAGLVFWILAGVLLSCGNQHFKRRHESYEVIQ